MNIFLALLYTFVLWIPLFANAQCPSNKHQLEISAGFGTYTGKQFSDQLTYKPNNYTVPFVTVRYFVFNRLGIGLYAGQATEQGSNRDYFAPAGLSNYKRYYTTIAAELYYIYTFRKRMELYTTFGVGSASVNEEYTKVTNGVPVTETHGYNKREVKLYYSPLGIRYGGRLGCFAALSLGYKGIISGGLSYKFGPACWWKQNEH